MEFSCDIKPAESGDSLSVSVFSASVAFAQQLFGASWLRLSPSLSRRLQAADREPSPPRGRFSNERQNLSARDGILARHDRRCVCCRYAPQGGPAPAPAG